MTGKKQQSEQEGLRAATAIMLRALILAAVVAFVVSAAPIASAGPSKNPTPRCTAGITYTECDDPGVKAPPKAGPSKARVGGKMHLEGISLGVKASPRIILNGTADDQM